MESESSSTRLFFFFFFVFFEMVIPTVIIDRGGDGEYCTLIVRNNGKQIMTNCFRMEKAGW